MKMENELKSAEKPINLEKFLWISGEMNTVNEPISNGFVIFDEGSKIYTFCFPFYSLAYKSVREGTPGDYRGRQFGELEFNIHKLKGQEEFAKVVKKRSCYDLKSEDLVLSDDRYPENALQGLVEMKKHTGWKLRYDHSRFDGKLDAIKFVYVPELYEQRLKIAEVASNHVGPSFEMDL